MAAVGETGGDVVREARRRERPLGQIVEAVRRLPTAQRELLAQEILQRIQGGAVPAATGR